MTTKKELKEKLEAVLAAWHNELADAIQQRTGDSYETLAREAGCSLQHIYRISRAKGIRREADKPVAAPEVK